MWAPQVMHLFRSDSAGFCLADCDTPHVGQFMLSFGISALQEMHNFLSAIKTVETSLMNMAELQ